ncbi:MAG TPA: DUF1579 domain-containing protein [Sphingomicrobium sp.]|jgi:hypothetical protein
MNTRLAFVLLAAATPLAAQPMQDPAAMMAAEREAMKAFDWTSGEWRGEAVTQTPSGEHRVTHTERSGTLLAGTVRLIEGHAYRADGSTGFNALAMLSYDPAGKKYRMSSHAEGRFGTFEIVPTSDGYVWTVPAGPMTIRYTAHHKDGVWTEIGERVAEGKAPQPFFRMELRKVGPTSWPAAGAVKPR